MKSTLTFRKRKYRITARHVVSDTCKSILGITEAFTIEGVRGASYYLQCYVDGSGRAIKPRGGSIDGRITL